MLYKTSIDEGQLPDGYSLTGGQGNYPGTEGYLTFGSSGFLYRSNKLMYDRNTDTLWHQMWGTPAFGALDSSMMPLCPSAISSMAFAIWLRSTMSKP